MTVRSLGGSFRDPDGVVYQRSGELRRQIHASYESHWQLLHSSGLLERFWREKLLIGHRECALDERLDDRAQRVIAPDLIPFVSYPYEWSQSQLCAAALLTLRVQLLALEHGMTLKDASPYNVQWIGHLPIFIDTLSFAAYRAGEPWVAYHQFCRAFLGPLALMRHVDPRVGLERRFLDGPPLDLVSKLLPRSTWLQPSLLAHIHLHARSVVRHEQDDRPPETGRGVSKGGLIALLEHLVGAVTGLGWKPSSSEWGGYEETNSYAEAARAAKELFVRRVAEQHRPRLAIDLGANAGQYSRILADAGAYVVAVDGDLGAVERLCQRLGSGVGQQILPLWMDLANPSPAVGWANAERDTFAERGPADLVLALALVHHLAISNNVPLDAIVSEALRLGRRAVIEWVPKDDPQAQRLLVSREDVFSEYTLEHFLVACRRHGAIEEEAPVPESGRILYTIRAQ